MIEIKNLSFSFENEIIFENLNALVPSSGVTCITGKSGTGKSTLVDIITGLKKPQVGEIVNTFKRTAVVFQDDRLLPWCSVYDNVKLVSNEKTAEECLSLVKLSDSLDKYPDELSGGMKRRCALARALAFGSDLLILDEPFNGIDDETKDDIIDIIKDFSKDKAVIFISHNQDEIEKLGDRVIEIEKK